MKLYVLIKHTSYDDGYGGNDTIIGIYDKKALAKLDEPEESQYSSYSIEEHELLTADGMIKSFEKRITDALENEDLEELEENEN